MKWAKFINNACSENVRKVLLAVGGRFEEHQRKMNSKLKVFENASKLRFVSQILM